MSNNSLNALANNAEELLQTYDNGSTPASNDQLGSIADMAGFGADIPTQTVVDGSDIGLGTSFDGWSINDTNWQGFRRMRNVGTQSGAEAQCNTFIVPRATTLTIYALRDSTTIYKNTTSVGTITTAGNATTVSVAVGDIIQASRPVNIRSATYDLGVAYMGWSGFAFAHGRDRNTGATLTICAMNSNTSYQVLYTTSTGAVTSLTSQTSGTIASGYGTATATLTSTRYYFIIADKPISCYVHLTSGTGMNDTLPLYPMDQDAKYGAFSAGGHMFLTNNASQNRAGSSVTQQLFNRSSNGGTTTERNTSTASPSVYIDISPGQTSGTFFTGPVQKTQSANGCIHTSEQQADGNGSEMTPFVSEKAFGKATIIPTTADWVTCIGTSAMTVYQRDSNGNLITTSDMGGNATYSLYFTRFTSISAGDVFETNGSNDMIVYHDSNTSLDDERINIMSDVLFELTVVSQTVATEQFGDGAEACGGGPTSPTATGYFVTEFGNGASLYTDSTCRTPWDTVHGEGFFYNDSTNQSFFYSRWTTSGGGVSDIRSC